jgi:hypothetical protein
MKKNVKHTILKQFWKLDCSLHLNITLQQVLSNIETAIAIIKTENIASHDANIGLDISQKGLIAYYYKGCNPTSFSHVCDK